MEQWQNIASSGHQGTTYRIAGHFCKLGESNFLDRKLSRNLKICKFSPLKVSHYAVSTGTTCGHTQDPLHVSILQ